MTVIVLRVQSDLRCFGCGKTRWIDRRSQLCLHCLGLALDVADRRESMNFVTQLKKRFAIVGREIKTKLEEFHAQRPDV